MTDKPSELEFGRSSSLDEGCNDLKTDYDRCFNKWFDNYLKDFSKEGIERSKKTYEKNCGDLFTKYSRCLEKSINDKPALKELLENNKL